MRLKIHSYNILVTCTHKNSNIKLPKVRIYGKLMKAFSKISNLLDDDINIEFNRLKLRNPPEKFYNTIINGSFQSQNHEAKRTRSKSARQEWLTLFNLDKNNLCLRGRTRLTLKTVITHQQ